MSRRRHRRSSGRGDPAAPPGSEEPAAASVEGEEPAGSVESGSAAAPPIESVEPAAAVERPEPAAAALVDSDEASTGHGTRDTGTGTGTSAADDWVLPDEGVLPVERERDEVVLPVERTDAHDPVPVDRREEPDDAPLPDDPGEDSGLVSAVELDEEEVAGQWIRSMESVVGPAPRDVNDRTAAYDPPAELFGGVPDPEAAQLPPPPPQRVVRVESPPSLPPVDPADAERLAALPTAEPAPRPTADLGDISTRSTQFIQAVNIDPALAQRMRPPTRRNLIPPAARGPATPPPAPAEPPKRQKKSRRSQPPPMPPPPLEDEALPSVVYVSDTPPPDGLDGELTGIYDPPKVAELPRARLVIVAGEHAGKTYYLNRAQQQLGRATDNDVVLLDIAVSRHHLRIDRHAEGFRLIDAGSGNGTVVNGRRVQEAELFDGDRIEVGNTLLDFASVGRPRRREEQAPVTDPALRLTPPLAVRAGNRSVPLTWLLLWFGTTLVAVLVGVFVARLVAGDPDRDEAAIREKATAAYDRAAAAMRTKDWKRAEAELRVAQQVAPALFDYKADLGRVERGRAQEGQLAEARRMIGELQPEEVRGLLKSIGPDSPYHADAVALVAEAERRQLERQVERAEALLREDKPAAARALAEEVLLRDPTSTRARALVDTRASSLRPAEAPPSAPPPAAAPVAAAPVPHPATHAAARETARAEPAEDASADKRTRADMQEAMRLYREEQFSNAVDLLQRAAQRSSGETARKVADRARQITAFGEAWAAAGRAVRGRRPDEAIEAYERALGVDARLGGVMRARITSHLADQHYLRAMREFSRQNYEGAVTANERVLQLAPSHGLAGRLREKMSRTAEELVRKARDARDDEPDRARTFARQAMSLARKSDAAWADAQKLLRSLE